MLSSDWYDEESIMKENNLQPGDMLMREKKKKKKKEKYTHFLLPHACVCIYPVCYSWQVRHTLHHTPATHAQHHVFYAHTAHHTAATRAISTKK